MARPISTPAERIREGPRFRLSYIWIVPLIAAIVGAWLFYKSEIDVGPIITITFEDGTNIASGTKLCTGAWRSGGGGGRPRCRAQTGQRPGAAGQASLGAGPPGLAILDRRAAGQRRPDHRPQHPPVGVLHPGGAGRRAEATRFVGLPGPRPCPRASRCWRWFWRPTTPTCSRSAIRSPTAASRWARSPGSRCRRRGQAFGSTSRSRRRMRGWCAATRASGSRAASMPISTCSTRASTSARWTA